jgi:uncharacterized protein
MPFERSPRVFPKETKKSSSASNGFERITPPWVGFRILASSTPKVEKGTVIDYELKLHGIPMKWRTLIEEWDLNRRFVDVQLKGPYAKWHHTHEFERIAGGTLLRDRVVYRIPVGAAGKIAAGWKVRGDVEKIFAYRQEVIAREFK